MKIFFGKNDLGDEIALMILNDDESMTDKEVEVTNVVDGLLPRMALGYIVGPYPAQGTQIGFRLQYAGPWSEDERWFHINAVADELGSRLFNL